MQIGTAKPTPEERLRVRHHLLDLYDPSEVCTAGDYARHARVALASLDARGVLPILAGGTGLYARALLDGLFPAPPQDPALRERLRALAARRGAAGLHRVLERLDRAAAGRIHPHDVPKAIRAIEVSLAARRPISKQWQEGRDALTGYRALRLWLNPPREELYRRIDLRAAAMFSNGLIEETCTLIAEFGPACRAFTSLGYAEAAAVLRGELTEAEAIRQAQQGHRNYAKRQTTWFRKEAELHETHVLAGAGDSPIIVEQAMEWVERHLG
jgi:tRNA dimethylallyltransferase